MDDMGRTAGHIAAIYSQPETYAVLAANAGLCDVDGFSMEDIKLAKAAASPTAATVVIPRSNLPAAEGWRPASRQTTPAHGPAEPFVDARIDVVDAYGDCPLQREGELHASSLSGRVDASGAPGPSWTQRYMARAIALQKPLLLRGAAAHFGACTTWTKECFIERFGDTALRSGAWWSWTDARGRRNVQASTLREFVECLDAGAGASGGGRRQPPYAFETPVGNAQEHVLRDVPMFLPDVKARVPIVRPPQVAVGTAGTGAPLHSHFAALNVLVVGAKRWLLVPPSETVWSLSPPLCEGATAPQTGIEVEQRAGDILFVPEFWGHSTALLSECVAATYEFIPSASLWS